MIALSILLLSLTIIVSTYIFIRLIKSSSTYLYAGMIHSSLIANFSRYGNMNNMRMVLIDDETAYFIRENSLWACPVVDEMPLREQAKLVDVFNISPIDLQKVLAAVDALNSEYGEDE